MLLGVSWGDLPWTPEDKYIFLIINHSTHKGYWVHCFLFCTVFVWFWYLGNTSFKKINWEMFPFSILFGRDCVELVLFCRIHWWNCLKLTISSLGASEIKNSIFYSYRDIQINHIGWVMAICAFLRNVSISPKISNMCYS